MTTIRNSLSTIGLCVTAAGLFTTARAQTADAPAQPAVEEIVVTALKRAERLQDVPASITALSSDQLAGLSFGTATELAGQVPNLQATSVMGGGTPIFSLRGVSTGDYGLNQSSPIASYVDEVYKGNVALFGVQMFDLERVEVLRGPQGTLYGKNTTGGAINFVTRQPDFQNDGYFTLGAGDFGRRTAEGAIGGSLVEDNVAGRLAFTYSKADGWFENKFPAGPDLEAVDEYAVRGGLKFQPSEALDIYLRLATSEQKSPNFGVYARPGPLGVGAGLYSLFNSIDPTLNPNVDYFRTGLGQYDIESNYTPDRKASAHSAALTMDWRATDHFTLTSITSWDDGSLFIPEDTDGSPLQAIEIAYDNDASQVGEDLRITSTLPGPLNFIAGAYVGKDSNDGSTEMRFFNDLDLNLDGSLDALDCVSSLDTLSTPDPGDDLFPAGCRAGNRFEQERKNWALYADATYDLTDRTKVGAGVRYTRDQGTFDAFTAQIRGTDGTVLANTIPGDPSNLDASTRREFDDSEVTGRLGLDHTTDSGALLYLNFSRGYRSSAFNSQAFFDPSELTVVGPESIDAVEVGAKTEWLDRRLSLNASLFHYQYSNQQLIDVDPATALQFLVNIDKSSIDGAEVEVTSTPLDNLTLRLGLAALDATIDDATLRGIDLSGNRLPLAPEFSANAAVDWETGLGRALKLGVHVDASYSDGQFFEPFNVARLEQDSYYLANARIAVRTTDERWEVAAWGKNLTDEFYFTSAIDLIDSFGFDYFHIGAPRSYGLDVTFRF